MIGRLYSAMNTAFTRATPENLKEVFTAHLALIGIITLAFTAVGLAVVGLTW